MAKSYGKEFERQVYKNFCECGACIDRIPDQVTKYKGSSSNICDFIVYQYPKLLYLECKSTHGASLSIHSVPKADKNGILHGFYGDIRDNQWLGLLEKSKIVGVRAGVIIWFVDKDVTLYVPIEVLQRMYLDGFKSISYTQNDIVVCNEDLGVLRKITIVHGKKKRTMFDYDFSDFFNKI